MIHWPVVIAGLMAGNVRKGLEADLVFAAWLDRNKPVGVDYLVLKGEELVDEVERRGVRDTIVMSLIRVEDREEAVSLRLKIGDGGF